MVMITFFRIYFVSQLLTPIFCLNTKFMSLARSDSTSHNFTCVNTIDDIYGMVVAVYMLHQECNNANTAAFLGWWCNLETRAVTLALSRPWVNPT